MSAQRTLAFHGYPNAEDNPLELLAARSLRLANVVESNSRRGDVRRLRARLLLLMLARCCPVGARPQRPWYEPGAAARLGVEGLRRAWAADFGEEAPSERTIRAHLGVLEASCAIQRAPGEFLPSRRDLAHPERRPRYGDTFHVLETDEAAAFWASEGDALLKLHPDARTNPWRWRAIFGDWRSRAATGDLYATGESGPGVSETAPDEVADAVSPPAGTNVSDIHTGVPQKPSAEGRDVGPRLADVHMGVAIAVLCRHAPRQPLAFVGGLRAAGVPIEGPMVRAMTGDYDRLLGAAAMLALGLRRKGQRIRNKAGWLVRQWRHATREELSEAIRAVVNHGRTTT